jgi:hypothetical protein
MAVLLIRLVGISEAKSPSPHMGSLTYKVSVRVCNVQSYTRSVGKVSDLNFFCKHWVDCNEVHLHEATLNLHMHSLIFFCLSIPSVDVKQHLSEVVFSTHVGYSLYTMSTHHRVKQSPKSTIGMSSITYMMLCGTGDWSCGQQSIGASIMTMLQHIPRT